MLRSNQPHRRKVRMLKVMENLKKQQQNDRVKKELAILEEKIKKFA